MKIAVINGANLNLLGERDPSKYGSITIDGIKALLENSFPMVEFQFFQSNVEGEIVNFLQSIRNSGYHVIINPGGYAHTSVVIRDALELIKSIKIEVHLSHLANREEFRQRLITATACDGYISGFRESGYKAAVYLIGDILGKEQK